MSLQLLKLEAERKKKELAERREASGSGGPGKRKWMRRGEVEAAVRASEEKGAALKAAADAATLEQETELKKKRRKEEGDGDQREDSGQTGEEARVKSTGQDDTGVKSYRDGAEKSAPLEVTLLPREEVIRRLRAVGEPATLFGETDLARYERLKEIGVREGENNTKGQRNVFQMKMRAMQNPDEDVYLEHHEEPQAPAKSKADEDLSLLNEDPKTKEEYIRIQINKLMGKWKEILDKKSADERRTQKGRSALATYEQSKEYLAPLQKKLKKKQLGDNVLNALEKIFKFVEQKEYVQANDVYLRLAIGNSPWPMGATMVGIHARTAREKIGEGKIAHVMNDEPTRKFIQAVKRLITMAQSWSPTVPSKMISS